jgi:monofunctional biosynthetic peptidoglycan transglycosylase
MTLFDFNSEAEAQRWQVVNDFVMGGVSTAQASLTDDGRLLFTGTISLANNGGFASIRRPLAGISLAGYRGIRIKVRGDGRTYQLRVRRDRNLDGIAFKHEFETLTDSWTEVDLPFAAFVPTFRGRVLQDVEPLSAGEIRQLGFLLADKKSGSFRLEVAEMLAY